MGRLEISRIIFITVFSSIFLWVSITLPSPATASSKSAGCRHAGGEIICQDDKPGKQPKQPPRRPDRGGGGGGGNHGDGGGGGNGGGGGGSRPPERPRAPQYPDHGPRCDFGAPCGAPRPEIPAPQPRPPQQPGPGPAPESAPPPIPDESDFASFPIPPSVPHALPRDWTVSGKETAFWADAGVKVFDAELLGFPLQVRATPVEFLWDFGDGSGDRSKSPGREPRRPADGSITHTYTKKGEYSVTLTTVYTGEFSYGAGWSPIPGTAAVPSDPLPMTVYRYHKYRVGEDCRAAPHGPDC